MNTSKAVHFFNAFAPSVAYMEVENRDGDVEIGSGYHIGDGVFVTARHVIDVPKIKEIGTTIHKKDTTSSSAIFSARGKRIIKMLRGPFFHPNKDVDVACFITDAIDLPAVPLGTHLDDWLGDDMILHSTLILGYPPIPMAAEPTLITSIAQVNAIIDKYTGGHPHFIMSTMARGGFSGGLCLNEYGFSMGVITESLTKNNLPTELGYLAVINIEPVYTCLEHHNIMPKEAENNFS